MMDAIRNRKTFAFPTLLGALDYLSSDRLIRRTGGFARNALVPLAAILLFLLLWSAGARQVQTSLG